MKLVTLLERIEAGKLNRLAFVELNKRIKQVKRIYNYKSIEVILNLKTGSYYIPIDESIETYCKDNNIIKYTTIIL